MNHVDSEVAPLSSASRSKSGASPPALINTVSFFGMDFTVLHPSGPVWSQDGGICLFACLPSDSKELTVYYIKACDNFHGEITAHGLWGAAAELGATHLLTLSVPVVATRALIAHNLVTLLKPVLNN
jgi:hypothetical protein